MKRLEVRLCTIPYSSKKSFWCGGQHTAVTCHHSKTVCNFVQRQDIGRRNVCRRNAQMAAEKGPKSDRQLLPFHTICPTMRLLQSWCRSTGYYQRSVAVSVLCYNAKWQFSKKITFVATCLIIVGFSQVSKVAKHSFRRFQFGEINRKNILKLIPSLSFA